MKWFLVRDKSFDSGCGPELKDLNFLRFLRSVLRDMPSVFERLAYIAYLKSTEALSRLCNDCRRHYPEWGDDIGKTRVAIERQHHEVFEEWLSLGLERKLEDLEEWASRLGRSRAELARQWLQPELLNRLVPRGVMTPELRLFRSDLELLLPVILAWEDFDVLVDAARNQQDYRSLNL